MSRAIVILSTYVDKLIQEKMPDVRVTLFRTISELEAYIENTPLRADEMFITQEVLEPTVNTSLTLLHTIVERNQFFRVDSLEMITETNSKTLHSIRYLIESENLTSWRVHRGHMTKEYVAGLITGSLRSDEVNPQRKVLTRYRKEDYLKATRMSSSDLSEHYPTEAELLAEVESEEPVRILVNEVEEVCKQVVIAGLSGFDRTAFAFLSAQYLSFSGKTIIVEKDFQYLLLSDMALKAGVEFLNITIAELYDNPRRAIRKIKMATERLVVITANSVTKTSYLFVCNLLYNNLSDSLSYFVIENDFSEVSRAANYVVAMPNKVTDILEVVEQLPMNYTDKAKFVALSTSKIDSVQVQNSKQLGILLKDLLQLDVEEVPLFNVSSLRLGGEVHDLHMLFRG